MSLLRRLVGAALLGLCAIGVVGCGAPSSPVPTNKVSAIDSSFGPNAITITAGTTVTWTNTGSLPHNVSDTTDGFGIDSIAPGGTFTHQFTTAGTYKYICTFHVVDGMSGIVIVTP